MPNEGDPCEVREETPLRTPRGLTDLPNELLFPILRFSIAVGREADASALARTNKDLHSALNGELYRLVLRNRTVHILHWAARRSQTATLEIALAHGANPNEMWTSADIYEPRLNLFRPIGWGLNTAQKLDCAVRTQLANVVSPYPYAHPQTHVNWESACFSSPSLSLPNTTHLQSLRNHYRNSLIPVKATDYEMDDADDDTRLDDLSPPLQDDPNFPGNMSPTEMDERIAKIGFVRLFRQWHYPLHVAALHDRTLVTEALLAHGADLDSTSVQVCSCSRDQMPSSVPGYPHSNCLVAYTPLHVAICSGNYKTAKLLVANGAHRMAKVFSGNNDRAWLSENALHTALSNHPGRNGIDYDFIEFLLRHGFEARIEERNHEDLTPLSIACNAINDPARDDVVRLLLYSGADIESQGPCSPRTPFSGPFPNNSVDLATQALWAVRKSDFRLAKLLLGRGADLNTKSSVMRVTMLHAVCSRVDNPLGPQDRIDFLDYLLTRSTAKDLNTFDATGCTPLTMLIKWNFSAYAELPISVMESKLFSKGANILAGIELGKETPFDTLIQESLKTYNTFYGFTPCVTPIDAGNKVLDALRAFRINQHPHRPTAFLNLFWRHVYTALSAATTTFQNVPDVTILETISCVLHALIKAGFSPAEVDRYGDTAMTSFLKLILNNPMLIECDMSPWGKKGSFIQSIMALLQENGAALHVRNDEGCTAFDYLKTILEYDGESPGHIRLAAGVGHHVQLGLDVHDNMCFKFHPNEHLFGSLGGDSTLQTIHQNPSRWLVCEHWCRLHCGSSGAANGQCDCARTHFQTLAKCQGVCVGRSGYRIIRSL